MSESDYTGVVVSIADIDVGERDRTDMGDLRDLAESIAAVGLLHPVVITGEWKLVAGDRRLAAVRDVLGWTEVPVTIVDLNTVGDVLRAEMDENTCRKSLSPYEAERARERRSRVLAGDAKQRADEGRVRGRAVQAGQPVSANLAETGPSTSMDASSSSRETRKVAATGTGYSGSTLDKVKSIREVAEKGLIRIGGQELPAPEPVREVARQALQGLQEPGAPVDRLHRTVAEAIEQHIEPDEQALQARQLKAWRDALGGARPLREFDMAVLPGLLAEQDWRLAEPIIEEIAGQVTKFREARPSQLRVVGGNA